MNNKRMINIIAEVGVNANGDMERAKEMIKIASNYGVDIIKFQLYDPMKRVDIEKHKWKDILIQSKITRRQVFELKEECDKRKVDFLASVFDVERVKWCEDVGILAYKIASRSIYDMDLAKAIAETEKPVILSYGMYGEKEFPAIIMHWFENSNKRAKDISLTKLYCVSKYPTELTDIHFMYESGRQLDYTDMTITVPVAYSIFNNDFQGYSDHTLGLTACKTAMSLGARVIEKHFTMDKELPGPDHMHSCTPVELEELCRFRDEAEEILY